MSVSRHVRAVPEGEIPLWIWNASKDRWDRAGAVGPRGTRRYNLAARVGKNQRARIFARDNYRCQWPIGCSTKHVPLTIDHIIPVHRGGSKRDDNLQTLCRHHNAMKARGEHPSTDSHEKDGKTDTGVSE